VSLRVAPGLTVAANVTLVTVAAVVVGALLRVGWFLEPRSLWTDEARLAVNVAARSFQDLGEPLALDQAAPLLYLGAAKASTVLLGVNERALRLVPLLAGLALLPLVALVAGRLLTPAGTAALTALAAVSPLLLRYSAEAKPYAVDAAVAFGLLLLALRAIESPGPVRFGLVGVAGALAMGMSYPAVFVLPGCLAALAANGRWRDPAFRRSLLLVVGLWTAAATVLAPSAEAVRSSTYFARFWGERLISLGTPGSVARLRTIVAEVLSRALLGQGRVPRPVVYVAGLAVAAGAFRLIRTRRTLAALLLLPFAFAGAAGGLGLYPLAPRFVLALVPVLFVLAALAAEAAGLVLPRSLRAVPLAAAVAGLGVTNVRGCLPLLSERGRAEVRELATAARARPGEPVYVSAKGVAQWLFYTTDWTRTDRARLDWFTSRCGSGGPAFDNAPSRGRAVEPEEASGLVREAVRPEILGLPNGVSFRHGAGVLASRPDPGWAEVEADRIAARARPAAWLFFGHLFPEADETGPLRRALAARGLGETLVLPGQDGGLLLRVERSASGR